MSIHKDNTTDEDLNDLSVIASRKNGPTETLKEFLAELKADKLI